MMEDEYAIETETNGESASLGKHSSMNHTSHELPSNDPIQDPVEGCPDTDQPQRPAFAKRQNSSQRTPVEIFNEQDEIELEENLKNTELSESVQNNDLSENHNISEASEILDNNEPSQKQDFQSQESVASHDLQDHKQPYDGVRGSRGLDAPDTPPNSRNLYPRRESFPHQASPQYSPSASRHLRVNDLQRDLQVMNNLYFPDNLDRRKTSLGAFPIMSFLSPEQDQSINFDRNRRRLSSNSFGSYGARRLRTNSNPLLAGIGTTTYAGNSNAAKEDAAPRYCFRCRCGSSVGVPVRQEPLLSCRDGPSIGNIASSVVASNTVVVSGGTR